MQSPLSGEVTVMIHSGGISGTAHRLATILQRLDASEAVYCAVLSTEDGLVVEQTPVLPTQLAAVAGFMFAAARQSCVMLGFKNSDKITVQIDQQYFLVCCSFCAGQSRLVLAVVFKQSSAYKRLLSQTIRAIQLAVKD